MSPDDTTPTDTTASDATAPDVTAPDATAPVPGAEWVQDHEPPRTEAERQAQDTVRSLSRLEESN